MKYVILFLLTALLLFPLYWMFSGSLQDIKGIMRMPPQWIPRNPSLENYHILTSRSPMLRWIANTALITGCTVALCLVVSTLAGYAFAVYEFRGKRLFFWAFMAAIMIPRYALTIPMFVTMGILHLSGTAAMIAPLVFYPVGIFLFREYARTLPAALFDSARMDGAGELAIFGRIALPLCRPVLAVIVIMKAIESLGDYLWGFLVLNRSGEQTLIVGLIETTMRGDNIRQVNPIGQSLAAGVILFIPMFIVFAVFQRYFRGGWTIGGVKE